MDANRLAVNGKHLLRYGLLLVPVAFLLIFNTYGSDLGLEVAEFRVSRPGGRFGALAMGVD